MHEGSPAGQGDCVVDPSGTDTQESPVQQAVPPALQPWPTSTQVCADSQVPDVPQVRPEQQPVAASQAWPRSAQELWSVTQLPEVAPGGIAQESPAQQSAATVQASACRWQTGWQAWVSGSQKPEQHSPSALQTVPTAPQAAGAHWPPLQVPLQQSALLVQAPVVGMQAPPQRSTPVASGTHGARPQHWSRNWHTSPCGMQQFGSLPS